MLAAEEIIENQTEAGELLSQTLAPYWYVFILRGLVLIGVGFFFILYPVESWTAFSFVFGCFALCDAGFSIGKACVVGCCMDGLENKCSVVTMFLIGGLCSFGVGTIAISSPAATAEALLIFPGIWMILTGTSQVWFATLLGVTGDQSSSSYCSGILGVLYVFVGFSILMDLGSNIGFFIFFVGFSLILFGFQMVFAGYSLKSTSGYSRIGDAAATSLDV
jgi:uncharacterized membrane protein HdeD (DUF308 family)